MFLCDPMLGFGTIHHKCFFCCFFLMKMKIIQKLDGSNLKTALGLIYNKVEFRACFGAVDLFHPSILLAGQKERRAKCMFK